MSFAEAKVRLQTAVFGGLGEDGLWKAGGLGDGVAVRIRVTEPDEVEQFGQSRAIVATVVVKVRKSEAAAPSKDDIFVRAEHGDQLLKVIAEPMIDANGLVWTCEAKTVAP